MVSAGHKSFTEKPVYMKNIVPGQCIKVCMKFCKARERAWGIYDKFNLYIGY